MEQERITGIQNNIYGPAGSIIESKIYYNNSEDHSPFGMIDPLNDKTMRKLRMDLVKRFTKLSKAALLLFDEIKDNRDPKTNIAVMEQFHDMTKSQLRATYRKLVELKEQELILKVHTLDNLETLINFPGLNLKAKPSKFSYMINPKLVHPKVFKGEKNYEPSLILWDLLKQAKQDSIEE